MSNYEKTICFSDKMQQPCQTYSNVDLLNTILENFKELIMKKFFIMIMLVFAYCNTNPVNPVAEENNQTITTNSTYDIIEGVFTNDTTSSYSYYATFEKNKYHLCFVYVSFFNTLGDLKGYWQLLGGHCENFEEGKIVFTQCQGTRYKLILFK